MVCQFHLLAANENRYEGVWKDGKKHGHGKFFYLDKGQLLEGIWAAGIPKCGILIDFGRDEAPAPTPFPIPKVIIARTFGFASDVCTHQHWGQLSRYHFTL